MPNLMHDLPDARAEEVVTVLAGVPGCRIERIVSHGQASPPGFWYDQDDREWVLLVSGAAVLEFDDGTRSELGPGDWLDIAPRRRHRVASTASDRPTVWLAVHYGQVSRRRRRPP
jgi:cupin 2 domain-containing protein